MISAGDAKDARGRRVPLMNTEYLVAYLYLRSARFSKSPRDRTGQGSKTGGIAVAVAGSGEYFHYQLLLPTSYRATWATQRLSLLAAGLLQTTERAC